MGGRTNITDSDEVEADQTVQISYFPSKCLDNLRIGNILFLSNLTHGQMFSHHKLDVLGIIAFKV